ncbi:biopolymer transporter ExbD [Kordia sp.]|uniref:biopolymer transporter ExbD n=1 Tax=Kordia sp. TaxID=1965332 RepID=UPI003D2BAAD7
MPFVFIAGVLFLIALTYFAKYIEDLSAETNDSETVKSEKTVSIRFTKNKNIYLDSLQIEVTALEEKLKIQFDGYANPTILLQVEKGVPVSETVTIMEIASKNEYKVILGVRPK